jgi:predicted O-methyltransferase YrrM
MRPEDLAIVLDLVDRGRGPVVECGSGISTVAIARLLAQGPERRLVSLEHDRIHAERVRAALAEAGVAERAAVIEAPLEPHPLAAEGCDWYAAERLAGLPVTGVGLLLVDGPPAGEPGRERARYPALPALLPRLAAGAAVVLDDAERPGERRVLERWRRETGLGFDHPPGSRLALAFA